MSRCRVWCAAVLFVLAGWVRPGAAHDVAPEPFVDVHVQPAGPELHLTVTLPLIALAEANLPRNSDGSVAMPDERALDLIARNIVAELEVQQDETPLAAPAVRTSVAAPGDAVVVALTYSIQADAGHISARLHTFRGYADIVRTRAHYDAAPNVTRTFIIGGDPERISFDPWPGEVAGHFVGRGTEALLATIDFLLLVACLVTPLRKPSEMARVIGAALAAQAVAVILQTSGLIALGPLATTAVSAVAASAIVITALVALFRRPSRWFVPLALLFGALHGIVVGADFLADASFAGTHTALGVLVFLLVVSLGQVWIATLVSAAAGIAFRRGLPERIAGGALSVLAAHSALHLVADRSDLFGPADVLTPDRAMALLAVIWLAVILIAGALRATAGQSDDGQGSGRTPASGVSVG